MTRIGEVIATARRAHGLTQEQLAKLAGVTQAALSRYENDLREPDDGVLDQIAHALGVTPSFLRRADRVHGGMAVDAHMRRRATAAPGVWRRLEAQLNMYRWHASQMFEEVTINASSHVPTIDALEASPADAARLVRAQWRMPIGPVRHLVDWLESAGCVVFVEDFGSPRVDGLSQWIGDHPVIIVNAVVPPDRMRLTLAHELGHLVMHTAVTIGQDLEAEANAFAGEFLMPADVVRPALRNLSASRLPALKQEYGVSMQALVERAFHLGLLGPKERTRIYKVFSARGWRVIEPGSDDIPIERPALAEVIGSALAGRGLTDREIADLAGFASAGENALFRPTGLRAV
ncbi:helix-turn-helix domain-containing protein [Luteipulveratus mongoliensis]|uniref:XRE family transcriptional regulator n=1 Tax=Luteipulveratus mongoliensis TaxID=571913 RepID=A0A0K1JEH4_9MICO|nr:XRE family transcriptional regulator [Luteipulveratus mongoliensis]AKU15106.1 XRE family transcriptional regulator [Luteipulveratus mongoliensis]